MDLMTSETDFKVIEGGVVGDTPRSVRDSAKNMDWKLWMRLMLACFAEP